MTNNDILRNLRYTFDLNDDQMIKIFGQVGFDATRAMVSNWLKKEDEELHEEIVDIELATFLNGFIIAKRGKREGPQPVAESILTNNLILRKLKIALNLDSAQILQLIENTGFRLGKHELSAFFRKPGQRQYRQCKDQIIRKFLYGLKMKYRPAAPEEN